MWFEGDILINNSYEVITMEHWESEEQYYRSRRRARTTGTSSLGDSLGSNPKRHGRHSGDETDAPTVEGIYQSGLVQVRNRLVLPKKLTRKDLDRKFRCIAYNTDLMPDVVEEVTLNVQGLYNSKKASGNFLKD